MTAYNFLVTDCYTTEDRSYFTGHDRYNFNAKDTTKPVLLKFEK